VFRLTAANSVVRYTDSGTFVGTFVNSKRRAQQSGNVCGQTPVAPDSSGADRQVSNCP
jgi:hypothetical protein